jgi:hypothetical protein
VKILITIFLLLSSLSNASNAGEMILPDGIKMGKCSPCTVIDKKGVEFKFTANVDKKNYISSITLNNKTFNVASDMIIYPETYLPFYLAEFKGNTEYEIYGLQAQAAASNIFYHYFLKKGSEFSYLGRYPELRFNSKKKYLYEVNTNYTSFSWSPICVS